MLGINLNELDSKIKYREDGVYLDKFSNLLFDTCFLTEEDRDLILSKIDDLDNEIDGNLINSENFQALRLIEERAIKSFDMIYSDPPYNKEKTTILLIKTVINTPLGYL